MYIYIYIYIYIHTYIYNDMHNAKLVTTRHQSLCFWCASCLNITSCVGIDCAITSLCLAH